MSTLHLVRLRMRMPEFVRFAKDQGLLHVTDDDSGYAIHAWLAAMFGTTAPKPFRFDQRRAEVMGYTVASVDELAQHAQAFASPLAYAALQADSLVGKAMPGDWPVGRSLRIEVEVCPVSRKGEIEKDIYLRTLDRLGEQTPEREAVYRDWIRRQLEPALSVRSMEITSLNQRAGFARPDRAAEGRRMRRVERPRVACQVEAQVCDSTAFNALLTRGVGRHRAFGLGMMLLAPGT